jgi:hypothetical protein
MRERKGEGRDAKLDLLSFLGQGRIRNGNLE